MQKTLKKSNNFGDHPQSNTPNASKVITALRHLGYNNLTALADLVDNCIDANASMVDITIGDYGDGLMFRLVDNGKGMDEAELAQALRLGSDTLRDPAKDLGLYGMGLFTASISMAKKINILTRQVGNEVLFSEFDVDYAISNNTFDNIRRSADKNEIDFFNSHLGNGSSGTIVILTDCDRLQWKKPETFEKNIIDDFSQIYRYLLGGNPARLEIKVNNISISPLDPLILEHPETEVYLEKVLNYTDNRTNKVHDIQLKMVILPDFGIQGGQGRKINQVNQGFYVMRNFREIAKGETLDFFSKHNSLNRFRAEIRVSGELDEELGVNFTKRDLALTQSLRHKLEQIIVPQIESIKKNLTRKYTEKSKIDISHEESARKIEQRSKLLVTPHQFSGDKQSKEDISEIADKALSNGLKVKYEHEHLGNQGQIYDAIYGPDEQLIITWNIDHSFYSRFVLDNQDNKDMIDAVDYLICCLALIELSYREGTIQRNSFDNFKLLISANMRQLLA